MKLTTKKSCQAKSGDLSTDIWKFLCRGYNYAQNFNCV